MKNEKTKIEVVSKTISLLSKKGKAICKKIKLSVKPSAKLGMILELKKNKPSLFKVGAKIDFKKEIGKSIGRKERDYFGKEFSLGFSPEVYKTSYDTEGNKTGYNFKEYEVATVYNLKK